MIDLQARIEQAVAGIRARDPELAKELDEVREKAEPDGAFESLAAALEGFAEHSPAFTHAARNLRIARPVLTVIGGKPKLVFPDAESELWRARLENASTLLLKAVEAVGRIEVEGNPEGDWFGTGFMVRGDVIATNQHVAEYFAEKQGSRLVFRHNVGDEEMQASIDFLEEAGREESLVFRLDRVIHLETDRRPDVAFLRVRPEPSQSLPKPLTLSTQPVRMDQRIAAIGYPAQDSRAKHAELMDRLFGKIYDKKRLSPGQIFGVRNGYLLHDCSVLRGNSGSPLIDLDTGEVVGIHAVGEFMADNFAVPAAEVEELLRQVEGGTFAGERGDNIRSGA